MKLRSRREFINESMDDLFASVHVGDYDCSHKDLTSLVDLYIPDKVTGDFDCYVNSLSYLDGSPQEVGGNFDCSNNQLMSLEDGPEEVGGNFNCSFNQLTSLKGCPKEINGIFDCSNNQLTSLEGHPKVVKDFYLRGNPMITDEMIEELQRNCKIKGKIIR